MLNVDLAIFLANCCKLTYDQFNNGGSFSIPRGFQLVDSFKAKSFEETEWFGYIIESDDAIIVAFRGTVTNYDWIADAEVFQDPFPYASHGGAVHHGFLHIYSSCRDQIMKILRERPRNKTLFITGHSLGAALAVLNAYDTSLNLDFNHVMMVNFGGPRVGDPTFCSIYNCKLFKSYRIVNLFDLIPTLPSKKTPWFFGKVYKYKHVKGAIGIAEQRGTNHLNHSLDTYIDGLKKISFS